ncbi:MAG: GTPase domain-containing protein [Myxococcota bacterium]|nr:GTPase domain-containing protein [Myxococcota bacterium]
MRINARKREISLKIVYYGPGLSGKTTNLKSIHRSAPDSNRGELLVLDTETERTLFFDYFPLTLGELDGFRVKLDFFTVPGQSFYQRTRGLVLNGADGAVFVADSNPRREQANLLSMEDLVASLKEEGKDPASFPLVFQWNKQDMRGAAKPATLNKLLNPYGHPAFSAVAIRGEGVSETQQAIVKGVLDSLRNRKKASA